MSLMFEQKRVAGKLSRIMLCGNHRIIHCIDAAVSMCTCLTNPSGYSAQRTLSREQNAACFSGLLSSQLSSAVHHKSCSAVITLRGCCDALMATATDESDSEQICHCFRDGMSVKAGIICFLGFCEPASGVKRVAAHSIRS